MPCTFKTSPQWHTSSFPNIQIYEPTEAICIQIIIEKKLIFYVSTYLYITLPWTFPNIVNYWVARTRNSEKLSVFLKNDGKYHFFIFKYDSHLYKGVPNSFLYWYCLQMTGWSPDCSKSCGLSQCLAAPTVHTPSQQETEEHLLLVSVSQDNWYHLTNYRLSVF